MGLLTFPLNKGTGFIVVRGKIRMKMMKVAPRVYTAMHWYKVPLFLREGRGKVLGIA